MHTHTLQNILKNLTSYLICVSAVKFLSKTEFLKALGLNGYMPVAFTGAMQFDGVHVALHASTNVLIAASLQMHTHTSSRYSFACSKSAYKI